MRKLLGNPIFLSFAAKTGLTSLIAFVAATIN